MAMSYEDTVHSITELGGVQSLVPVGAESPHRCGIAFAFTSPAEFDRRDDNVSVIESFAPSNACDAADERPAPRYSFDKLLGKGAQGEVYAAIDTTSGEPVAIKVPRASSSAFEASLRHEFDIASTFSHPNIVKAVALCESSADDDCGVQLVLERMHGSLRQDDPITEAGIQACFPDVLAGVAEMHAKGVLHRDLKPENLLMTEDGVVKIADFGLSCRVQDVTRDPVGTPQYMSPEVLAGRYCTAVDVWALACIIVRLATAKDPWADLPEWKRDPVPMMFTIAHLDPADPLHPPIPTHLSQPLQEILTWMFQRDPTQRPTAQQLLQHPYFGGTPLDTQSSSTAAELLEELPLLQRRNETDLWQHANAGTTTAATFGVCADL